MQLTFTFHSIFTVYFIVWSEGGQLTMRMNDSLEYVIPASLSFATSLFCKQSACLQVNTIFCHVYDSLNVFSFFLCGISRCPGAQGQNDGHRIIHLFGQTAGGL